MFYLGRGRGGPVHLDAESHLLVLGPPRCGKTTALVIPNLLASEQATIVTSTKVDVMTATAQERARRGRVWVFDPSGGTPVPAWATRLRFSPVSAAVDFKSAMLLARAMVRSSSVHSGHTLSFWEERAEAVLAPCLLAARLSGLGMPEVMEMVEGRELESAVALLAAKGEKEAASALSAVAVSSERERSGVMSTAAGLLSAYRMPEVLAESAAPNFDAAAFASSSDTLYVVAPSTVQDLLSPIVVGLISSVRQAAYAQANKRIAEGGPARPVPAVKLLLDEMANIAPLHDLGGILSEGASQGVLVLGVLQDLSQARQRWPGLADGMLTLFQNTLVFPGVGDRRTLSELSMLSGEQLVMLPGLGTRRSLLAPVPRSRSGQLRPLLSPGDLARGSPGEALLFNARNGFARVSLGRSGPDRRLSPEIGRN